MADARHTRPASVWTVVAWISFAPACTFDPGVDIGGPGNPDGAPVPDAALVPDGSLPIDASVDPDGPLPPAELHLLLTEVKAQPTSAEFVEIWNPLDEEVALRDYYLTDDKEYDVLPQQERLGTEVPVGAFDAILRFPEGAVLGAGQVAVVALDETGFAIAFATAPDYALVPALVPVADPMEVVADASSAMQLREDREVIVLFRWDGESDLVTDVDIVAIGDELGAPGGEDGVPDKTAQAIDGPDADELESTYAGDAATMPAMMFRSGNNGSYKRVALESGAEVGTGGNGVDGHDETSEDTLTTWNQIDTPPTPGVVPPLAE